MDVIFYILVIAGCLVTFSIGQSCVGNFVAPPCTSQKNPSRQFFISVNTTLINDVNCQCEVRLIKTPTESNKSSLFPVTFRIIDDVNCDYDVNVVYGTSSSSVVCKEAPTFTRQIVRDDSLLFVFLKRAASSLPSSGFCLQVIADVRDTFITINCDENVSNSNQPDTTSTTEILPTSSQGFLQTKSASSSWLSQPTTQASVSHSSQPTSPSRFTSSSSSSSSSSPPSPSPPSSSPSYQSTAYHSPSSGETTFTTASPITLLNPILTSSLIPASSTPPSSSPYHSPSSGEFSFTSAPSVTVLYPSSTPQSSPPAGSATTQLNTIRETDTTTTIISELIPVIAAGVVAGVIIIIIFTILIICCCFRKKSDADEASVYGETRNENLFLVENDLYYSNVNNVAEFGGAPYSAYSHKSNTTKRPNGTIRAVVEGEPCGEFERTSPRPNQFCERSTPLKRGLGEDADTSFQRKQRSPYSDSKYGQSNLSNKRSVERRDSGKIDGNWNRSTSEHSPYSTHSDYTPYKTMRSNTPTNLSEKSYFSNRKKRARRVYFDLPSETESDVSDIEENEQTDEASQELRLKQIREKNKRWQVLY